MSIEGLTERTAKEEPPKPGHTCPHFGSRIIRTVTDEDGGEVPEWADCGWGGWLCPACREDRADRRNRELVEGLALAGILANTESWDESYDSTVSLALNTIEAMRAEREGGEEE